MKFWHEWVHHGYLSCSAFLSCSQLVQWLIRSSQWGCQPNGSAGIVWIHVDIFALLKKEVRGSFTSVHPPTRSRRFLHVLCNVWRCRMVELSITFNKLKRLKLYMYHVMCQKIEVRTCWMSRSWLSLMNSWCALIHWLQVVPGSFTSAHPSTHSKIEVGASRLQRHVSLCTFLTCDCTRSLTLWIPMNPPTHELNSFIHL